MWTATLRPLTALLALAFMAGCSESTSTSAPTGTGSPAPTASAEPTAAPAATSDSSTEHWESAGSLAYTRFDPRAVVLGDGRVLVVGNDWDGSVGTARAELWDPATGAWASTESLNKPRFAFAAVTLRDGRALVVGGLNDTEESFSSAYVFDLDTETWTKVGLLETARTGPSAAVLPDGRVLVAGGYFHVNPESGAAPPTGITLAGYHEATEPSKPPLDDVDFPPVGVALATTELFDPATGGWSPTGPLTFARVAPAMVTLSDGRVLVVGSRIGVTFAPVTVDPGAFDSAEIYDPAVGRSSLTGKLPAIDPAAIEAEGTPDANPVPDGPPQLDEIGSLIALDDGGAVLIGYAQSWKHQGEITRSFRFDARSGTWTEIGQTYISVGEPTPVVLTIPGARDLARAAATRLPDGSLLIAESSLLRPTVSVHRYDPATDMWTDLPSMPEPGGVVGPAVVLADGSVLILVVSQSSDSIALTSAIRFVPGQ